MLKVKKASLAVMWIVNALGIFDAIIDEVQKSESTYALETVMLINSLFYGVFMSQLKLDDTQKAQDLRKGDDLVVDKSRYYFSLVSPVLFLDFLMIMFRLGNRRISVPAEVMVPLFLLHTIMIGVCARSEHKSNIKEKSPSYFSRVRPKSMWNLAFYAFNAMLLYTYAFASLEDARLNYFTQYYFVTVAIGCLYDKYVIQEPNITDNLEDNSGNTSSVPMVSVSPSRMYYIALTFSVVVSLVDLGEGFGLDSKDLKGLTVFSFGLFMFASFLTVQRGCHCYSGSDYKMSSRRNMFGDGLFGSRLLEGTEKYGGDSKTGDDQKSEEEFESVFSNSPG